MNMLNASLIALANHPEENNALVALKGVKVDVEAHGTSALVRVQQRYMNTEDHSIEASYLFPLEDSSAVVGFKVYTRDLTLVGQVLEREEAFERYDDATTEGHGAYLLDQERANVFTARIGKLKPQQEAIIEVSYISTLNFEGERVRLMIPTVVAPRYVPAREEQPGEPERELWQASRQLEVPYGLELNVRLSVPEGPALIETPSHPTSLSLSDGVVVISLAHEEVGLDRDFVLTYDALTEAKQGAATFERALEGEGGFVSATCTLPVIERQEAEPVELLYVLDCSGSMHGEAIQQAKRALSLLLRSLEEGDHFNLICFGTKFKRMWPKAKPFNQTSLEEALAYLNKVDADLGGTQLLAPFESICAQLAKAERHANVVLLTDGQVSNETEVISLCERHHAHLRVFSFGIGSSASETLVRELGRVTNGASEFISDGERIEPKVLRVGKRLRQPCVRIESVTLGKRSLRLPNGPLSLFEGELLTFYGSLDEAPKRLPKTLKVKAGDRVIELPIHRAVEREGMKGSIGALWAREAIRGLERKSTGFHLEEDARVELLELALRHSLMSSQTSFVAIEERDEADLELGDVPLRKVPLMKPKGQQLYRPPSMFNNILASFFGPRAPVVHRFESALPPEPLMMAPAAPAPAPRSLGASTGVTRSSAPYAKMSPLPSSAPTNSTTDELFELLELQQASGAFTWGEVMRRLLSAEACPSTLERGDERLLTALALELLRADFAGDHELWELIAEKAERFLERGGPLSDKIIAKVSAHKKTGRL